MTGEEPPYVGTPTRAVVAPGEVRARVTWEPSRVMSRRMSPLTVGVTVLTFVRVPVCGTTSYVSQPGLVGRTPAA